MACFLAHPILSRAKLDALPEDPGGVRWNYGGPWRLGHGDSHGEGLDGTEDDAQEDQGRSLAVGLMDFETETAGRVEDFSNIIAVPVYLAI